MSAVRTATRSGYKANSDLDVEDFFEIITPGTIERRIHTLDDAWQELLRDNKDNTFIKSEVAKWDVWAKKLLNSWTDRFFSLSAQKELDSWNLRYKDAFSKTSKTNAPSPINLDISRDGIPPLVWAGIGAAGVVALLFLLKR